ncbi:MAG: hypothetical protein ACREUP_06680 [Burkholderiales bacterium]
MKTLHTVLLSGALVIASATVNAQQPTRVRGTISAFDGNVLAVKSKDGNTDVVLADKTEIVFTQPIALADIKPGDFLGVTSAKGGDGTLTALDIRRMPKPSNPGHRPFDGRDDQTMTNATVSAMVQSASGHELTLSYDGGAQKIIVSEKAPISTLVPGQRSHLVPGAAVNLTARADGGDKLTALRIQVSPPKP